VDNAPAVVYLHPWELDPGQPRQAVGRLTSWRHYGNLHRTEERLIRLLRTFQFGTAASLLENLSRAAEPVERLPDGEPAKARLVCERPVS
jgi:hypothetical protein